MQEPNRVQRDVKVEHAGGSGPEAPDPKGPNEPSTRTHTVRDGETLSDLAMRYYGDPDKWRAIYAANRGVIDDPDRIATGQQLTIPAS